MYARCQCAQIRFPLPLPQPLRLYICHCTECQHQSSSAFGISAIYPAFDFPSDLLPHIEVFNRRTLKGFNLNCYFCKHCGSRLVHRVKGREVMSVKGGCLENLTKEMMREGVHIWVKEAVVDVPEGAKRFEEEPDD